MRSRDLLLALGFLVVMYLGALITSAFEIQRQWDLVFNPQLPKPAMHSFQALPLTALEPGTIGLLPLPDGTTMAVELSISDVAGIPIYFLTPLTEHAALPFSVKAALAAAAYQPETTKLLVP